MIGKKGFTLVEVLFVIVVIGILAAIVIPRLTNTAQEAKISACKANVSTINTQVERYFFDHNAYPSSDLSELANDTDYFPEGIPTCPVDGSAYTLGSNHRVTGHDHTTTTT